MTSNANNDLPSVSSSPPKVQFTANNVNNQATTTIISNPSSASLMNLNSSNSPTQNVNVSQTSNNKDNNSSNSSTSTSSNNNVNFSGYLMKWTNYIKGYQKRWFVLNNGLLSYYR